MTDGAGAQRAAVERALMERARARASHEPERPRRWLQHSLALAAALALVAVIMLGLDAFVSAMQRFMDTKIVDPPPPPTAPMPAYAVPAEVSQPPPADPGPRPSPAPAQGTSAASP